MIQLELTTEEAQHLKEDLKQRLIELDREIAHTDSMDFKDQLKCRRESLRKFLEKLPDSEAIAA
jgi:redox-regulated HSP33 family molecular chaperone